MQDFSELGRHRVVLLALRDADGTTVLRVVGLEVIGPDRAALRVSRTLRQPLRAAVSRRIAPSTVFGRPTGSDQPVTVLDVGVSGTRPGSPTTASFWELWRGRVAVLRNRPAETVMVGPVPEPQEAAGDRAL